MISLYRQKETTSNTITIGELTSCKIGDSFDGVVIVKYKAMLDKLNMTNAVLQADITDAKGDMTVTLNARGNLIDKYEEIITLGKSIRVRNFKVAPKTNYDHGDCDCILIVDHHTTIENIESVCEEYFFIPNTTIKRLLATTEQYTLGTIVAIVISAKKLGTQHVLEIRNGYSENDKAMVRLFLHI